MYVRNLLEFGIRQVDQAITRLTVLSVVAAIAIGLTVFLVVIPGIETRARAESIFSKGETRRMMALPS